MCFGIRFAYKIFRHLNKSKPEVKEIYANYRIIQISIVKFRECILKLRIYCNIIIFKQPEMLLLKRSSEQTAIKVARQVEEAEARCNFFFLSAASTVAVAQLGTLLVRTGVKSTKTKEQPSNNNNNADQDNNELLTNISFNYCLHTQRGIDECGSSGASLGVGGAGGQRVWGLANFKAPLHALGFC